MLAGMACSRCRSWAALGAAVAVSIGVAVAPAGRGGADPECANGQPDAVAAGKGQQVIVDYFTAINNHDYRTAWGYLGGPVRAMYGAGLTTFSSIMREHVKCVRVTNIAAASSSDPDISSSLGIQWYWVTFDAEYVTPVEAGAGTLPPFYKTHADPHEGAPPPLIINQGSSP
ncbi:hypothetical protein LAUMK191_02919 [Mycobacterium attenuatum]|nr:hypothetical protein LAUMK191_02919 [Mycobacterium attenuatum]VBA58483.1 hypothetical protein LAUMK41_02997 [Mycobacterium attenuatum]